MTGPLQRAYVLPDLDIARGGERIWVEVKVKASKTITRKTGLAEHGISAAHYRQYCQVEAETGCPVWLFVIEEDSGTLLAAQLAKLGAPRIYDGPKMGRGGMAFWPRDKFRELCRIKRAAA